MKLTFHAPHNFPVLRASTATTGGSGDGSENVTHENRSSFKVCQPCGNTWHEWEFPTNRAYARRMSTKKWRKENPKSVRRFFFSVLALEWLLFVVPEWASVELENVAANNHAFGAYTTHVNSAEKFLFCLAFVPVHPIYIQSQSSMKFYVRRLIHSRATEIHCVHCSAEFHCAR